MKNIVNALITIIEIAITITDTIAIPTMGIMQSSKMFSFLCNMTIILVVNDKRIELRVFKHVTQNSIGLVTLSHRFAG